MRPLLFLFFVFFCFPLNAHADDPRPSERVAHRIIEMNALGQRGYSVPSKAEGELDSDTLLFDVMIDSICFDASGYLFTKDDCLDQSNVHAFLRDGFALGGQDESFFLLLEKNGVPEKYFGSSGFKEIKPERSRISALPNNVFREMLDEDFTAFNLAIPLGRLPPKKIEKDRRYEELNEFFLNQCGSLSVSSLTPKKIAKKISKGQTIDLKDWLSSFKRPRGSRAEWHFAVIIKDFTGVKADLSNMRASCVFSHGRGFRFWEDNHFSREFSVVSPRQLFENTEALSSRFLRVKREKLKNAVVKLLEEQSQISDLMRFDLFSEWISEMEKIALNRSEYPLLASFPYRELTEPKLAPKAEYESVFQFEQRIKASREKTQSTIVLLPGNAFTYDAEKERFDYPSSFCNNDRKLLAYDRTESWVGQNAFGAQRIVESFKGEELIHRLEGMEGWTHSWEIQSGILNKREVDMPIREARSYDGMQAVCIARFYPDWPQSYSEGFSRSDATFSSPSEYNRKYYFVQAEPLAWVVLDRENKRILSFMPLILSNEEALEKVRRLKGKIWWAAAQRNITSATFYLENYDRWTKSVNRYRYNDYLENGNVRPLSYRELVGNYPISPITDAELDVRMCQKLDEDCPEPVTTNTNRR